MFKKWKYLCFLFACCLTWEPLKYFVHHLFCVYDEWLNFNMEITKIYIYIWYVIPKALIFGACVDEFHCHDINFNPTSIWNTFAEHLFCNSVTHEVFFTIIHKIEKLLQAQRLLVDLLVINQSFDVDYTHIFCKIHRKNIRKYAN